MKIKKVLAFLLCGVMLVGCGKGTSGPEKNIQDIVPNIVEIGRGESYSYLIDKNTGVVYLYRRAAHYTGITVMLNTDGTPITAEQLEIEY